MFKKLILEILNTLILMLSGYFTLKKHRRFQPLIITVLRTLSTLQSETDLNLVTARTPNKSQVWVVPKYTCVGQRIGGTCSRKIVVAVLNELNIFERLIDYGRNKLATDVDDYAIEWLLQSDLIDSGNKATEAGKKLLDNLYHLQSL